MKNINKIARKLNISPKSLKHYGDYIAKVDPSTASQRRKQGRLILVTAMTPTKTGEGKTTVSIGITDALARLDKKVALCLREPSLGPYFSRKGGASGGGQARVEPAREINLHFTGDMHAVTSAHNLIAAEIENHIYWGNKLKIRKVWWQRSIDICDRGLRPEFIITASSEIMAILCLAKTRPELKRRLGAIIIGHNDSKRPVTVSKFSGLVDRLMLLLDNAFKPNLVQTAEGTPAFIHGGPFANVAHGTNSVVATKLALRLADYVIVETGFGSELGAFKFVDLVNRIGGLPVHAFVMLITIKAINRYGTKNVDRHINIIRNLGGEPILVLNKFKHDSPGQIQYYRNYYEDFGLKFIVSDSYRRGGAGNSAIAWEIIDTADKRIKLNHTYALKDPTKIKISKVTENILAGRKVQYTRQALNKIALYKKWGYSGLPICLAKTQYAISDDKNRPNARNFILNVTDVSLSAGAGFIVVYCGKILLLPGMPKR